MEKKQEIGFIGFGIMGQPMALRLIEAGYGLWGYARRPESLRELTGKGAIPCKSPKEVAEHANIIFTMVSDTPDVEEVILGEKGIIEGIRPNSIVVDMSTISPSNTRSIALTLGGKRAHMLDAPVSGGDQGAINGTLSIMVGGKTEIFERVLPLFQCLGKNIIHIGDNGAGQVAKMCNQLLIAQTMTAVGEALLFAKASNVDPAKVREALLGGFANSQILKIHGKRMLEHDFEPGFKALLHHKDMRIALQNAAELSVSVPGAALAAQYINALIGNGHGDLDSSAVVLLQEQLAGLSLKN